jgi:lipopolysaccharide/colanic/teichoic acid biosynthesis glycosyltransferase
MEQTLGVAELALLKTLPRKELNGHKNIETIITEESGAEAFSIISEYIDFDSERSHIISTTTLFNINKFQKNQPQAIVNLKRINDFRRINKFFETINDKLEINGTFIGCCETLENRKKRLLRKFPGVVNYIYLTFDYIFKRVVPKLPVTKQIYFALTGGRNRVISRAETLGRLYSCGFKVIQEQTIGYMYYFVAKKVKLPAFDPNPSYGLLFGMNRTGLNGKPLKVYKFRTMYPYSEYLQQYIYEKNNLENGGKFRNDFRITNSGKLMRKFWIDELPMLYNWLKNDLKLVGVRPLSKQFQSLYPTDLLELRHSFKPGLIPPYYADLPQNFQQILESEKRYLDSYIKNPISTDWKYFWKAFVNIVFKNVRSK